jgi:hypothetical protein
VGHVKPLEKRRKPGKEMNSTKEKQQYTSLLLLTKDMSSSHHQKRLSPKPDFLDSGE